jgi:hypothetical protein
MVELKGISAGSWLQAYGVIYCETCAQPFLPDAGKCPFCGAPAAPAPDDEDDDTAVPEAA